MPTPLPSVDAVNAALSTVSDPEIHRPITDLGMVKSIDVDPDGTGPAASEPGREVRRAAAELEDVEALDLPQDPELGLGRAEDAPVDRVALPRLPRLRVRVPLVHERPDVPVSPGVGGELRQARRARTRG